MRRLKIALTVLLASVGLLGASRTASAQEPFLGEIRYVAFTFAPQGWAECNGQVMSISQNTALFSLLGTTYGGDGRSTFALPDMRGRVPIHAGQGPGLQDYFQGEVAGLESETLSVNQMPTHIHPLGANSGEAALVSPTGNVLAAKQRVPLYNASQDTVMGPNAIGPAGGNQPFDNRQPFLVMKCIIAVTGIFPPRQ